MERQQVEIPRIRRVRIVGLLLNGGKARTMSRAVNVGTILDFDGLLNIGNETPKFGLNILFGDGTVAAENRVEWHLLLEVALLEVCRLLLELLERIQTTLFEAVLAVANQASGAVPLGFGLVLEGRIEARAVIGVVARFANNQGTSFFSLAALLAFLLGGQRCLETTVGTIDRNLPRRGLLPHLGGSWEPMGGTGTCEIRPLWERYL